MNNENTGLGSSLLLKRTAAPKSAEAASDPEKKSPSKRAKRPDVSDVQPTAETKTAMLALPRDRCTIYIEEDLNEQLDLVARIERKQRSEIVSEILRAHLPKYQISQEK